MVEDVRFEECSDKFGHHEDGKSCLRTSIVEYQGSDMSLRFPWVEFRSLFADCTQQAIEPHIERWEKERFVSGAA